MMNEVYKIILKDGSYFDISDSQRARYRFSKLGIAPTNTANLINAIWSFQVAVNPSNTPEDIAAIIDFDRSDEYDKVLEKILGDIKSSEKKMKEDS